MGDRFVVGFRETESDTPVWLYSHGGGSDRYNTVAYAVDAASPRWHDPSYATRIAISQIIGPNWLQMLGYGLNAGRVCSTKGDYPDVIIVNWDDKTVQIVDQDDPTEVLYTMTLEKFVVAKDRARAEDWVGSAIRI
jgi:hypothetical protein